MIPRAIAGLAWTAVLAASLAGCTTRDRNNPLDPRNRTTLGLLPGFEALAGDGVVQLQWIPLSNEGVLGYRVDRWRPGEAPSPLPGATYPPYVGLAEDLTARNDSTYLYRLVALLASGDSAFSVPDTATPGTRRISAIVADLPGMVGLTADARDVFYALRESEPYDDLELDETRGWFWLCMSDRGVVVRRRFNGTDVGAEVSIPNAGDVTVSSQRGIGWVAVPEEARVVSVSPDTTLTGPDEIITGVGKPRVVESAETTALWIGSDGGDVYRYDTTARGVTQTWPLGARVVAIALDEAVDAAWVATRTGGELCDLYYLIAGDSEPPSPVRTGLLNVTDLALDRATRSLWISERGAPLTGNGRLSRLLPTGETVAALLGIEPYALAVEAGTGSCWATDIASDRVLEVTPSGAIARRSPPLGIPYGVRVYRP